MQFIVITKGSERIAEVAARFTLDALPGKQLAIDSDLRSGILSLEEAMEKRSVLERQSQFYGAMDGATKFVKGDAIAGLVITFVNLVGGLTIGMVQLGMSFGEAITVYSQQTVGDGLVAQIPALFIAIAAGSLVTRVSSSENQNLGYDISLQLLAQPKTMLIVALVLVLFAFIPGFPTVIFFTLAISFTLGAYYSHRSQRANRSAGQMPISDFSSVDASMKRVEPMTPLTLQVGEALVAHLDREVVLSIFEELRKQAYAKRGIWLPPIGLMVNQSLPDNEYCILLDEVVPVSYTHLTLPTIYSV